MRDIAAVVLAAGKGKRMKSDVPKAVHPVAGVPMVLLVIDAVKKAGIRDICVVIGHGAERVRAVLPDDVSVVDQGEPLGTGHAVNAARKKFAGYKGRLLVACADMPLVSSGTIKRFTQWHGKNHAVCAVLSGVVENPKGYGRILRNKDGSLAKIVEEKDASAEEKRVTEVNSGMYCFNATALWGALPSLDKKNKQKEFYLTDTVELFASKGLAVGVFRAKDASAEEIFGINSRKDLAFASSVINRRILEKHMANGVSIVDPDTVYIDPRARIGRDTKIYPFTFIEGNVRIGRHCEVGPFSRLRDGTIMEDGSEIGNFVEVKKSRIGKKTKAKHLTYLGDTVLGKHVNVGAGTITANYDGKNKHKTIIKDGAFVGSHTTLIAPVTVGKNAITGAGAVVLRGRNVPDNAVVVGVPAREITRKR